MPKAVAWLPESVCIAIFDVPPEEVDRIMADDPGIKAGLFTYELHSVCGFPSSTLP